MAKPPTKAQHIADQLEILIRAGDYQQGQWLPPADEIGKKYGAERGTVRRALRMLAKRGLVEVIEGNGARVTTRVVTRHNPDDMTHPVNHWRGFGAAAVRAGREPYTEIGTVGETPASSSVARWLGIPIGTVVLVRDRVHGIIEAGERQPVEIATTWITMPTVERVPALRQEDTGPGGMTERLAEAGYVLRYEDVVSSRHADATEQGRLKVDGNQSMTTCWRRTYDQTDHVIKVSLRVINPMFHELVYRYP